MHKLVKKSLRNKSLFYLNQIPYMQCFFISGVLMLMIYILNNLFSLFIIKIIYFIDMSFLVLTLLLYMLMIFLQSVEFATFILALSVFLISLSICGGKGIIKIVTENFPKNKSEMFEYYSSLISGTFSAFIGVMGAIIGAKIGGDKSYKASMDSITKQIEYDKLKYKEKEEQESQKVQEMIKYFLKEEIIYNFKRLEMFQENNRKQLVDAFKNDKIPSYNYFNNSNSDKHFRFDEFDNIKYKYLNYLNKQIIDIYRMFNLLERGSFDKLNKEEHKYVRETYLKYYDKYTY